MVTVVIDEGDDECEGGGCSSLNTHCAQRGQLSQLLRDLKVDVNPGSAELPREAGDQRTFSAEGQTVPIFSFVDHAVSMAATQLCRCSMKATRHNT